MMVVSDYWIVKSQNYKINGRRSPLPPPRDIKRVSLIAGGTPALHYAALLGPLPSRVLAEPTLTLICFGFASAFFGKLTFNTPLS
jgi:hypothetical protein